LSLNICGSGSGSGYGSGSGSGSGSSGARYKICTLNGELIF